MDVLGFTVRALPGRATCQGACGGDLPGSAACHTGGHLHSCGVVVVAWDVDWTLIEPSGEPWVSCYDAAALACGADVSRTVDFHGRTDASIIAEMVGPHRLDEALAAFTAAWLSLCPQPACRPLPGVRTALDALRLLGAHNVVLTGNVRTRAQAKLAAAGLADHFDWDGSRFGDMSMRRADLVEDLVRRSPGPVVIIGDTPRDVEAARDGGAAAVVAVATGRFGVPDLVAADLVVPNLAVGRNDVEVLVGSLSRTR